MFPVDFIGWMLSSTLSISTPWNRRIIQYFYINRFFFYQYTYLKSSTLFCLCTNLGIIPKVVKLTVILWPFLNSFKIKYNSPIIMDNACIALILKAIFLYVHRHHWFTSIIVFMLVFQFVFEFLFFNTTSPKLKKSCNLHSTSCLIYFFHFFFIYSCLL